MSLRLVLNNDILSVFEEVKLPSDFLVGGEAALYWKACFVVFQKLSSFVESFFKWFYF